MEKTQQKDYQRLLLNELRIFPFASQEEDFSLTSARMAETMTFAEKINQELGMSIKPLDILLLAQKATNLSKLYKSLRNATDEKLMNKTKPFYPDFPKTVMKIDEAQYRFHQYIHYFSTYGLQSLGFNIEKGWLPSDSEIVSDTKKTKKDKSLLEAKTIQFISSENEYTFPVIQIIKKRNRATPGEIKIISYAISELPPKELDEVAQTEILFKENLNLIFYEIFKSLNTSISQEKAIEIMHNLCQHTGDVLKCLKYTLTKEKYHLSTAQRKLFVRLLESYSVENFSANLASSRKNSQNTHILLNYISFNKFSRSPAHKKAVAMFRNNELHSWNSQMEKKLSEDPENALDFIVKRPGVYLRMLNRFLKLGYAPSTIEKKLLENCQTLSVQTIMTNLNHFSHNIEKDKTNNETLVQIHKNVLLERMKYLNTPLKGKKIYIDEGIFDLNTSTLEFSKKDSDGGYIRQGMSFKIPENINRIRFFVYWNDSRCVDVDLHSYGLTENNSCLHIGWNGYYKSNGILTSGDITHSNAAEYIDIDLSETDMRYIVNNINLFSGARCFNDIDTIFAGLVAVDKIGKKIQLYNAKNCIVKHDITNHATNINYCIIDVKKRIMHLCAPGEFNLRCTNTLLNVLGCEYMQNILSPSVNIMNYIDMLVKSQEAEIVENKDDADIILKLDKSSDDKEISLIDNNYFSEY